MGLPSASLIISNPRLLPDAQAHLRQQLNRRAKNATEVCPVSRGSVPSCTWWILSFRATALLTCLKSERTVKWETFWHPLNLLYPKEIRRCSLSRKNRSWNQSWPLEETSHSVLGSFGFTLHLPSLKSQALNWRIPFLVGRLSVVRNSFCLHICFVALCVFYMFSHWL